MESDGWEDCYGRGGPRARMRKKQQHHHEDALDASLPTHKQAVQYVTAQQHVVDVLISSLSAANRWDHKPAEEVAVPYRRNPVLVCDVGAKYGLYVMCDATRTRCAKSEWIPLMKSASTGSCRVKNISSCQMRLRWDRLMCDDCVRASRQRLTKTITRGGFHHGEGGGGGEKLVAKIRQRQAAESSSLMNSEQNSEKKDISRPRP